MTQVGSSGSYGDNTNHALFTDTSVTETSAVSFFYQLISGNHNEELSQGLDKAIGFLSIMWKPLLAILIVFIFVIWFVRKRRALIRELKERKKTLD